MSIQTWEIYAAILEADRDTQRHSQYTGDALAIRNYLWRAALPRPLGNPARPRQWPPAASHGTQRQRASGNEGELRAECGIVPGWVLHPCVEGLCAILVRRDLGSPICSQPLNLSPVHFLPSPARSVLFCTSAQVLPLPSCQPPQCMYGCIRTRTPMSSEAAPARHRISTTAVASQVPVQPPSATRHGSNEQKLSRLWPRLSQRQHERLTPCRAPDRWATICLHAHYNIHAPALSSLPSYAYVRVLQSSTGPST